MDETNNLTLETAIDLGRRLVAAGHGLDATAAYMADGADVIPDLRDDETLARIFVWLKEDVLPVAFAGLTDREFAEKTVRLIEACKVTDYGYGLTMEGGDLA